MSAFLEVVLPLVGGLVLVVAVVLLLERWL